MDDSALSLEGRGQVWCLGDQVYDNHRIQGQRDSHHDSYRVLYPTPVFFSHFVIHMKDGVFDGIDIIRTWRRCIVVVWTCGWGGCVCEEM